MRWCNAKVTAQIKISAGCGYALVQCKGNCSDLRITSFLAS